jgi:alpha-D-ribose 1-methylphosphonate 5-phosphate C-P lyase
VSAFAALLREQEQSGYAWAYLDEDSKREVRRALLKAVCIPGYQVAFASREMPVARGWGSGGLQVTLSIIEPDDTLKVIDQGSDESMNAAALRDLVARTTGVGTTTDAREASVIQTRHRIPEDELHEGQIVVFQVPIADPLRVVDGRSSVTRRLHAERDYAPVWLYLYEDIATKAAPSFTHSYPVEVEGGYVMAPTPIPRHDIPRLNQAPFLSLYGAGREATVYALPPYTTARPLEFEDRKFAIERFPQPCALCGASETYLQAEEETDPVRYVCSDVAYCLRRRGA